MPDKETLLQLLQEYNVALERLRQDQQSWSENSARAIAHQLAYLEYRILQIETQLSILDISVRNPARRQVAEKRVGLLARLNPWNEHFRMEVYITVVAVLMLSVIAWNITTTLIGF